MSTNKAIMITLCCAGAFTGFLAANLLATGWALACLCAVALTMD